MNENPIKENYKRNNSILYYLLVKGKQKIDIGRMFGIKRQRVSQIVEYKIKQIMEQNKRYFYFDVISDDDVVIKVTNKEPKPLNRRFIFDTELSREFMNLVND